MDAFDDSLLKVFSDYLEYVETWALLHHDSFQKYMFEEEWNFSREIAASIPGACKVLADKFSAILSAMLHLVAERLLERIDELCTNFRKDIDSDDSSFK